MDLIEVLKIAVDNIKVNKLRSFLTMLGVIIGISSVLTIVAIGNFGQAAITGEFEKLGAAVIQIRAKTRDVTERDFLRVQDIELLSKIPYVKDVIPTIEVTGTIRYKNKSRDAYIVGTTPEVKNVSYLEIVTGRFITQGDLFSRRMVAVIDNVLAERFFGSSDPIGKSITFRNKKGSLEFTVIGVIENKNAVFEKLFGENVPAVLYMPMTSVMSAQDIKWLDEINLTVPDKDKLSDAAILASKLLEFGHGNKDKYNISSSEDILNSLKRVTSILTLVIGSIAFISLVVGGIGVMNIMLVSVTERTREIGIRKAIGATKRDIIVQFLAESVVITLISGLIGIVFGLLVSYIVSQIVHLPFAISVFTILGTFLFSGLIGIFFGVYPAKKAAELNPIDALRYE